MKKFFMIAVMAVAALTASAQTSDEGTVTLTPYAGVSFGHYNESIEQLNTVVTTKYETKNHVGFTIGAEVGYQVNSWFKASAGLAFANIGSKLAGTRLGVELKDGNVSTNYLNIPILANFYVADGLALKVGVQPAILLSAKETETDTKFKDCMNAFDLQIPMGISYEYKNIVLDARYNLGVLKVYKEKEITALFEDGLPIINAGSLLKDVKNQYFTITIGYKLGL